MIEVISLGTAASVIGKEYLRYSQYYNLTTIDISKESNICLKEYKTHEEYDKNIIKEFEQFKELKDKEILLIVNAAGTISGCSLQLLRNLQQNDNKIEILLIKSEENLLSSTEKLQQRLTFCVLQEYVRSGKAEKAILIDNKLLSTLTTNIGFTIKNRFKQINSLIVDTHHMINTLKRLTPIMAVSEIIPESNRVTTFSIINKGKEFNFYNMKPIFFKEDYYAMPNKAILEDENLLATIVETVKIRSIDELMKISFGIYETNYEMPYIYSIHYSSQPQII